MKKLALVVVLFIAGEVQAQSIGCFVSAPDVKANNLVCQTWPGCTGNYANETSLYGYQLASACEAGRQTFNLVYGHWQACGDTVNQWIDQYNACVDSYNECAESDQQNYDAAVYYEGLIQRLRKACGRKCRSIQ